MFPDVDLTPEFIDIFKFINIKLSNKHQIMINDIVVYIKDNNYYGEKYHNFSKKQIDATKWWINNFYPPSNNLYIKNKEELQKILQQSQEKLQLEQNKFISNLVK